MVSAQLDTAPSRPIRANVAVLHDRGVDTCLQLATGSGTNRLRLDVLDERTGADTPNLARSRLSSMEPKDLVWSGDVVCAVAREVV